MTTTTPITEKKKEEMEEEIKLDPSDYSCEVILEKTTVEKADDTKLPSDAFNVWYVVEGKQHLDVTRSYKMVNVFDYYYDKYGKGSVQKIDYGKGVLNPAQWGYKNATPPRKGRRKKS